MSGGKEVDQVCSNASSTGLRVLEKAPKTSRYVVSEDEAIEAFGKAFPNFAAKIRFLEVMRGFPPPESYFCCDGWPDWHLPGGYGPVLNLSVIEEFANPRAQQ
jgi:hypothetical protein